MRMLRNDEQDVSKLGKGIAMRLVSAEGIEPSTYRFSISNPQINGFNGFPSSFVIISRQI